MVRFSCKIGERSYALELEGSQTVLEGKQMLTAAAQESNGVQQRWIFRGRILTDASLISETGIGEEEVVIVIPGKAATAPSAALPSSSSPAVTAGTSSSMPPSTLPGNLYATPDPGVANNSRMLTMPMDAAMSILLSSPTEVVEAAVATMLKVTTNIINNPLEEKYRRIPQTNANFNAKLGSVTGGRQLMQAVGFETRGDAWVLVPSADKWPVLVACHQKLLAFSERLKRSTDAPAQVPLVATASTTPPPPPAGEAPAAIPQDQLLALVASLSLAASSSSSDGGGEGSGGGSGGGDGSGPDGTSS
jgi:hypothetical protein